MPRLTDDAPLAPSFRKYVDGNRQLRDLTKKPSEHDHRPLFHYDNVNESDPDYGKPAPWRVLRWHPTTGTEVCATTAYELEAYERQGYVSFPPNQHPHTVTDAIKDELAGLSADERQMVLEAAAAARREALVRKLAAQSDADLAAITAATADKPASKRKAG